MNPSRLIDSLERFAGVLPAVVRGVSGEDARWRPDGVRWSILEIVLHLADEEVEDFRTRVRLTLADPAAEWPRIDPEGWAVARRYNEGELDDAVKRFVAERGASVAWLRSLQGADWSASHEHPRGALRAGDLLVSWAAHDALHLRQIAKRFHEMAARDGGRYSSDYAGRWTA